jgi:hypothetical protein
MSPKFKHIREKSFFASHPLYDAVNDICNPTGESCGVTVKYAGKTFKLDATIDTFYDETGKPQREVMVTNLNQPEEKWTVYKKNAEELANKPHKEIDLTNQPIIKRTLQDGKLSWLEKTYYNERGQIALMEQAFYGDGLLDEFSDKPHYTLVSEFTYEYDQYGNWVVQYMCAKDEMGPDELFIREIEYQTE